MWEAFSRPGTRDGVSVEGRVFGGNVINGSRLCRAHLAGKKDALCFGRGGGAVMQSNSCCSTYMVTMCNFLFLFFGSHANKDAAPGMIGWKDSSVCVLIAGYYCG